MTGGMSSRYHWKAYCSYFIVICQTNWSYLNPFSQD
jgi:hypothetical protein